MSNLGLNIRMAIVGSILFAFYIAAATVIAFVFGLDPLPVLVVGIVALPLIQYKLGKWMALRGAEEMPEEGQYAEVHRMTESLSQDMGLEKPKLMVMDMGTPNAFAVGRKGAGVVVVSTELMQLLQRDELEGVIAHELAHIKNRDCITMVVGQSIAMIVGMAVYYVIAFTGERNIGSIILGWIASMVVQMFVTLFVLAISRYREYVADEDARQAIGSGDPLARALEKISAGAQNRESAVDDNLSALCIFNSERGLFASLTATHPPMEKRIAKLRS